MKTTLVSVIALLLAMTLSAWAIRVCNRCGYEVNEGAASCSHCGATVATNVVAVRSLPDREQGAFSADLVEKEIQEGLRHRAKGDIEVAAALFRNALALEQVVPDSGDSKRGEKIRRMLQEDGAGGSRQVQGPCPNCGGTGKTSFTAAVLDGKTASVPSSVTCQKCEGSGKTMRAGSVSEAIASRSAGVKRYTELQQSRKYVAIGGAWVPLGMETNLTTRQTALLKKTAAPCCQTCMGTGGQECADCRGTGRQPCSNRKCSKGIVVEKPADGLKGSDIGLTRKVKCRTCTGTGYEVCAQCSGKGQVACAACNGSGDRPVCSRCDGAGTQLCAKCAGGGKVKGITCTTCRGETLVLCSSCKGDGRKR
jgi:hypothetical protein